MGNGRRETENGEEITVRRSPDHRITRSPDALLSTSQNSLSTARILILRLGSMGDVIHALPAVTALRTMFPGAEIGWAIEERWVELLCATRRGASVGERCAGSHPRSPERPLVNRVHLVNTRTWRSHLCSGETWRQMLAAARELRQTHYDVALDFQGAWKSATVGLVSGTPMRIGFRDPREKAASLLYTKRIARRGAHVVEQNLCLLPGLLDNDRGGEENPWLSEPPPTPELPREAGHELWAAQELVRWGLWQRDFAILNPGAGWGAKCWPAEHYAELARGLRDMGMSSLINFGPGEEELVRAVEAAARGTAHAFQYSISELVALMRQARIFVGGDTGPMHLAAALGVPVVGLFGPTDPARNGPYGTQAVVLRSPESVTNHSRRVPPDGTMLSITPAMVLRAAQELLERTSSRRAAER
jgi:heptosyltransferase-1